MATQQAITDAATDLNIDAGKSFADTFLADDAQRRDSDFLGL